jgi:hypothetical protein
MMYSQVSPNRNGSTSTSSVNSIASRSEQADSAAGEGDNASGLERGSSSPPPTELETPPSTAIYPADASSTTTNSSPSSSQTQTNSL